VQRRALIIEDQTTLRELLSELLAGSMSYEVAACASAADARVQLAQANFQLVLLDLVLPDSHGLELLELIQRQLSRPRVLVLTAHARAAVVREAMQRGAHGVVTKSVPLRELRDAIERVQLGGIYYCSETSRLLSEAAKQPARDDQLTERQRQILRAVASGMTTKEIAGAFSLSEKTVANHRARIMERLGMHDVASLTRYAVSLGLVDSSP
jgi:DNA-binding NarL/FixJ family response regulator